MFEGTNTCPDCGTKVKSFGQKIATIDAELEELTDKSKKKTNKNMSWGEKRRLKGALVWQAEKKGYRHGWVAHTYRDYMGVWPNDGRVRDVPPIEPEGHIKNLLTHILIKKAKSYKKRVDNHV